MKRESMRSMLFAVSSGLLLAACGAHEEDMVAAEESLGTQEAALCAGVSVTTLSLNGMSSYGGELAGSGNWAVSSGANAVRLEYRVDGVLVGTEDRCNSLGETKNCTGSGPWYMSSTGTTCGTHNVEVKAYPMVIDSAGNRTTCWQAPKTLTRSVTQTCATASFTCTRSSQYVNCTGTASGGTGGPYTLFWRTEEHFYPDVPYLSPWSQGSASRSFYCPNGSTSFGTLRVDFKVRDNSGVESLVAWRSYSCGY